MADITIVYWRDIPAQVLVGRGRGAAKVPLSDRFTQAIDRAAMKAGLAGTDDYLAQWRREPAGTAEGTPQEAAEAEAARLEDAYPRERLLSLSDNGGSAVSLPGGSTPDTPARTKPRRTQ